MDLVLSKYTLRALTGQSDLSSTSELSNMVLRAGITTGLMESGPSEANWFLARNTGEEETVTSDQFLLEETEG